jgi:tetratricopeptide (TPR) repeat protein
MSRRIHGDKHRDALIWINNLAFYLQLEGKSSEAEALFREAIAGIEGRIELKQVQRTASLGLAGLLNAEGRSKEAIEILNLIVQKLDPAVFMELTDAYRQLGKRDECLKLVDEFLEESRREDSESPKVRADTTRLAARALNRMDEFSR